MLLSPILAVLFREKRDKISIFGLGKDKGMIVMQMMISLLSAISAYVL
jgi:hypothetical protein